MVAVGATILFVSPHLDDAALSAGGWIAARSAAGDAVIVATVFASVPRPPLSLVAAAFHRDCGQDDDAIVHRRVEDRAAVRCLGAVAEHLDPLDAVYRRRADGRWLCEDERSMFHQRHPGASLVAAVTGAVEAACDRFRPSLLATVVGVGGHVDHLATRDTVLTYSARRRIPVRLWEDLPYALEHPPEVLDGRLIPTGLRPAVVRLDPTAWRRKLQAVACYPSQLRMLWPDGLDWRAELCTHAYTVGDGGPAERCWEPT